MRNIAAQASTARRNRIYAVLTSYGPVSGGEMPMTSLITQPQLLATAAEDASAIGSAITQAEAAAAGPTTGLVAAAEDEVSAITAQVFGGYGQEYQALLHQAAAFHDQFVARLAAAGNTYRQTEAEIASTLGMTGGSNPGEGPGRQRHPDHVGQRSFDTGFDVYE